MKKIAIFLFSIMVALARQANGAEARLIDAVAVLCESDFVVICDLPEVDVSKFWFQTQLGLEKSSLQVDSSGLPMIIEKFTEVLSKNGFLLKINDKSIFIGPAKVEAGYLHNFQKTGRFTGNMDEFIRSTTFRKWSIPLNFSMWKNDELLRRDVVVEDGELVPQLPEILRSIGANFFSVFDSGFRSQNETESPLLNVDYGLLYIDAKTFRSIK